MLYKHLAIISEPFNQWPSLNCKVSFSSHKIIQMNVSQNQIVLAVPDITQRQNMSRKAADFVNISRQSLRWEAQCRFYVDQASDSMTALT